MQCFYCLAWPIAAIEIYGFVLYCAWFVLSLHNIVVILRLNIMEWSWNLRYIIIHRGDKPCTGVTNHQQDGRKREYNLLMNTQDVVICGQRRLRCVESCQAPVISIIYCYLVEDGNEILLEGVGACAEVICYRQLQKSIFPDQWLDIPCILICIRTHISQLSVWGEQSDGVDTCVVVQTYCDFSRVGTAVAANRWAFVVITPL